MQKYPSFCLRQKSPPAGRVSGWAGKAVHVLGKALILCWCAFTVALIGWVVLASFTPTRDIFQNDLLAAGPLKSAPCLSFLGQVVMDELCGRLKDAPVLH